MKRVLFVTAMAVVVVAGAGCKKKQPPAPTAGSGSAKVVVVDAAAPPPVVVVDAAPAGCLPVDPTAHLTALEADDSNATVCTTSADGARSSCIALSLATGTAKQLAPQPPAPPTWPGGATVKDEPAGVQVCKGSACVKLDIPATDADKPDRRLSMSDDGFYVVATIGNVNLEHEAPQAMTHSDAGIREAGAPVPDAFVRALDPDAGAPPSFKGDRVALYETTTGRQTAVLLAASEERCPLRGRFVGNLVMLELTNCSSPAAQAELYDEKGKRVGTLDGLDFAGSWPVKLADKTWAAPDAMGRGALVFEPETGRSLRKPMGAPDHFTLAGMPFGDWTTFDVPLVTPTPAGKLVEVAAAGGVYVLDPATGSTLRGWPLPVCAPAP